MRFFGGLLGMDEEVLEEKEWGVEDYLALFDADAPDTVLIRERADRIQAIRVRRLRVGGQLFEDSTFIEKAGAAYTIRVKL